MRILRPVRALAFSLVAVAGMYQAQAQYTPRVPEFDRPYKPVIESFLNLAEAEGRINWSSKRDSSHNSPMVYFTRIDGSLDVDVKLPMGIRENMCLRFISKVFDDHIETITCTDGGKYRISPYDSVLAKKEGLSLEKIKSIEHELLDFKTETATDLETGKKTLLKPGSLDLMTRYFAFKQPFPREDTVQAHFKHADKLLPIYTWTDSLSNIYLELQEPDPEDPSEKKNLIPFLNGLIVSVGEDGMPKYIEADTPIPGIKIKAVYDPSMKK